MKRKDALPKNIRQIGEIPQDKRIYLEDYVMTYIRKREREQEKCVGILFGTREEREEETLVFITGAVMLGEEWEKQYQNYFVDLEPVGYFVLGEMREERLREAEVSSMERPFAVFHFQEEEENLYWSEEQDCSRLKGYFIFYERNPQMQKYMAEQCEPQKVEGEEGISDQAIISFREKVKEKHRMRSVGGMRYLAGSFLTLIILFLGVTIIHNYDRMKNMEEVISRISIEQERERLQLAADYAASARGSGAQGTEGEETAAVNVSNVLPESAGDEEKIEEYGDGGMDERETEARDVLADTVWSEIAQEGNGSADGSAEADAPGVLGTGGLSERLGEAPAKDASSDTVLADIGTSQAAQALAERNYSAEEALPAAGLADILTERQVKAAYTVKYGDTLAGISQVYYGSLDKVEEICQLNGIDDANMIVPGQKIVLP